MFLGLRTKNRKGRPARVDYVVHIQEIAPWPPSQFLKALRSVVLHWEYGDNVSGSTSPVTPSIKDGKIEFNKSFKLHVTLISDGPVKGNDGGNYYKNLLELNLYEPRNKNLKGQHIGGAVVDLAEHGVIKKPISFGVPFNCKRNFKNNSQAVVYLKIQPFEKAGSSSSSMESLPREMVSDKDGKESVSSILAEEQSDEVEIASFTDEDDDESRHSSVSIPICFPDKNDLEVSKRIGANDKGDSFHSQSTSEVSDLVPSEEAISREVLTTYDTTEASHADLKSETPGSVSSSSGSMTQLPIKTSEEPALNSSIRSAVCQNLADVRNPDTIEATNHDLAEVEVKLIECNTSTVGGLHEPSGREEMQSDNSFSEKSSLSESKIEDNLEEAQSNAAKYKSSNGFIPKEHESHCFLDAEKSPLNDAYGENIPLQDGHRIEKNAYRMQGTRSPGSRRKNFGGGTGTLANRGVKHIKSMSLQMPDDIDLKEEGVDVLEDTHVAPKFLFNKGLEKIRPSSLNKQSGLSNFKVKELEKRVEMLERELKEVATIEISLYSVIAEHGSSSHKVHAPARRLSRLCTYASENWSPAARASATRSIVSGLILAARACGNDVPRLTFWLSNITVLRATVIPVLEGLTLAINGNSDGHANSNPQNIKRGSLRWEQSGTDKSLSISNESDDFQDPKLFLEALEKVESWIFSRIVESIWWQILTPRMQFRSDIEAHARLLQKRSSYMTPTSNDHARIEYSLDNWKMAFKESYERLCPVRAGGHDCGCLPMLARAVMQQCIARLDVAMFNALLRNFDDEIPGNPISDPISDPRVLPIPVGKLSFSTGAQLKNAVGTWCRWLTHLFDIDDDLENEEDHDDDRRNLAALKTFPLLNALSDLLMLPKDMLLDSSTRKKICPVFNGYVMKRILGSFVPDEFSPDPVPDAVFKAFDSEDATDDGDGTTSFPFEATPVTYHPPSMMSVMLLIGHVKNISLQRNSSSVLRKCHTSDDELDELNSPLTSIVMTDKVVPSSMMQEEKNSTCINRYRLLGEIWKHEED